VDFLKSVEKIHVRLKFESAVLQIGRSLVRFQLVSVDFTLT
jgi:hypothetical protein